MIERDTTTIEAQLETLSLAAVSVLASQTLGEPGWNTLHWSQARIYLSAGAATGGIYRLAGTAERDSQTRDWSIILKVVAPLGLMTAEQNNDQTHPIYWKREVLAYASGWLDQLPGAIRAPRCFGIEARPTGA